MANQQIIPPKDHQQTASDGGTYEFKGKQWRNIKNGRLATRSMARELIMAYRRTKKKTRKANELKADKPGESFVTNIDRLKRSTIERNARRSSDWLKNKLSGKDLNRKHLKSQVRIGRMYLFVYDAKHKDTLPVWDMNPLVIPIKLYGDGFLGMNLHYLAPKVRLQLLQKLEQFSKGTNESKRLKLTYQLLKGASNMKELKPTIHRYLYSHKRTQFAWIPPSEWEQAVWLPVARFRDSNGRVVSNQKVYRDSKSNRW